MHKDMLYDAGSMSLVRTLSWVQVFLLGALACASAGPYGLDIRVPAGPRTLEGSLSEADVDHLRGTIRRVAERRQLVEPKYAADYPAGSVYDLYLTPSRLSLDIVLWIPPDRHAARIGVHDWDSGAEESTRLRKIEAELRSELATSFPGRSIRYADIRLYGVASQSRTASERRP